MADSSTVYRVIFLNKNEVFEVYARQVFQSDLFGFLEVEEFVFGERSQVLIDPSEDKLKQEFAGVKRSYIPYNAIVRIDEVEREGVPKVSEWKSDGNVAHFPGRPVPVPPGS
ncbi:DUF1820 family protein [Oceanospirillum sanctuarii]|uniref:DUF1820 family protein n=1 Tax=Oceanospirillum sanctuarii TaxID=1434821 RepID=UPI000A35F8FE|nr:DUF1820 family protein [Oceanospirillum sanctuarii]